MRHCIMEVVNPKSAVLSNFEVLSLLKELQTQYNEKGQKKLNTNQHLATISYETTLYLENTPCKLQSEDVIKRFMVAVSAYKLTRHGTTANSVPNSTTTDGEQPPSLNPNMRVQLHKISKAEKLQLLNHRPTTAVEIQLMIEESEERLTEQEIDSLLSIIADILPTDSPEGEPDDEQMEAEQE